MASWTNLPQFNVTCATSIARMDQLLDNIIVSSSHSHTGVNGQGASVLGIYALGTNANQTVPTEQNIIICLPACLGNWDRVLIASDYIGGTLMNTTAGISASGASMAYPVGLPPRTGASYWAMIMGFQYGPNNGCIAAWINGSIIWPFVGPSTYNLYSATSSLTTCATAAFNIASSGTQTLKFQVVGKDGLSSGFHAGIYAIGFNYY